MMLSITDKCSLYVFRVPKRNGKTNTAMSFARGRKWNRSWRSEVDNATKYVIHDATIHSYCANVPSFKD